MPWRQEPLLVLILVGPNVTFFLSGGLSGVVLGFLVPVFIFSVPLVLVGVLALVFFILALVFFILALDGRTDMP